MATSVFTLPIIPGKEDADRESFQRMAAPGAPRSSYPLQAHGALRLA